MADDITPRLRMVNPGAEQLVAQALETIEQNSTEMAGGSYEFRTSCDKLKDCKCCYKFDFNTQLWSHETDSCNKCTPAGSCPAASTILAYPPYDKPYLAIDCNVP